MVRLEVILMRVVSTGLRYAYALSAFPSRLHEYERLSGMLWQKCGAMQIPGLVWLHEHRLSVTLIGS